MESDVKVDQMLKSFKRRTWNKLGIEERSSDFRKETSTGKPMS